MSDFLSGTIVALTLVVSLYQLRSFRQTRDRLFLFFSVAFFLMGLNRFALTVLEDRTEFQTSAYVVRLVAFLIILYAIWEKNRAPKGRSGDHARAGDVSS